MTENHRACRIFTALIACAAALSLSACDWLTSPEGNTPTDASTRVTQSTAATQPAQTEATTAEQSADTTEETTATVTTTTLAATTTAAETEPPQDDTIDPDFKAAMDSYEAFYDEYCDFMQDYADNPTDFGLIAEYATMMARLEDVNKSFEKWDDEELNNAELAYYLDVQNRVQKKLLTVSVN